MLYEVITDPIEHQLIFERFLNPERVTADFDLPSVDPGQPARLRTSVWGVSHSLGVSCAVGDHSASVTLNTSRNNFV